MSYVVVVQEHATPPLLFLPCESSQISLPYPVFSERVVDSQFMFSYSRGEMELLVYEAINER
jgi:hypothetical protein